MAGKGRDFEQLSKQEFWNVNYLIIVLIFWFGLANVHSLCCPNFDCPYCWTELSWLYSALPCISCSGNFHWIVFFNNEWRPKMRPVILVSVHSQYIPHSCTTMHAPYLACKFHIFVEFTLHNPPVHGHARCKHAASMHHFHSHTSCILQF